ncbi:restriction endonuclease [Sphingomonas sp. HDW15A]|uniref:restriction endonuclease n=1 Tax=Sphingomonas sp. HDW15A TaxID=2714942 RepID=UPI001F0D317F|nr:restriction endonuclease [Sphingomonas sp. HDW15A]
MPKEFGDDPVAQGYVAIGWPELGDLSAIPPTREAFKTAYAAAIPNSKPGAVPVSAGQLYRFVHDMQPGEIVIFPSKHDRMVNIGVIAGGYVHDPANPDYANRRPVEWKASLPRNKFTQAALYEIGSFLSVFRVSANADEFIAALEGTPFVADVGDEPDEAASIAEQFEESTEDFVIGRLKNAQTSLEFEHFVAHLLQCMGYFARVTKASGDGGIDIIAHHDELGFEPPIIKVQCKQMLGTIGRPEVQKLNGAIENEEKGLFVTLGNFSPDARTYEQARPNLRLVDGRTLVEMIYNHYDKFSPRYRALVPLKRTFSPSI